MMAILHLGYVLARRRLMSSFRIELTVLLGVTLAVVLLSSAVVFNDLLAETALRRTLTEAESSDVNIWVRVFNDLDDPRTATAASDRYQQAKQFVAQRFVPPMVEAIEAASMQVETATFYFSGRPNLDLPNDARPRGRIQYLSGLQEGKGRLVAGRWPAVPDNPGYDDSTGATDDVVIEVAVDQAGLQFLGIELGEGFQVMPATGGSGQPATDVVLVGIVEPVDLTDEYWFRRGKLLTFHDDDWTLVPLFASEQAIRQQVGRRYPGIYTSTAWFLQVDRLGGAGQTGGRAATGAEERSPGCVQSSPQRQHVNGVGADSGHLRRKVAAGPDSAVPDGVSGYRHTRLLPYDHGGDGDTGAGRRDRDAEKPGRNHWANRDSDAGGGVAAGRPGAVGRGSVIPVAGTHSGRAGVRCGLDRCAGFAVVASLRDGGSGSDPGGGGAVAGDAGGCRQGHRGVSASRGPSGADAVYPSLLPGHIGVGHHRVSVVANF